MNQDGRYLGESEAHYAFSFLLVSSCLECGVDCSRLKRRLHWQGSQQGSHVLQAANKVVNKVANKVVMCCSLN